MIRHLHSEFHVNRPIRRRIAKTIFNMASVRHLEFVKIAILVNCPIPACDSSSRNENLYLCTKFDRNRIIHGSDMEIKLFSKWRPSAILILRKLQFWSRKLHRHVILHFCFKFRVDRSIWRRDIAKKRFSIWRPSAILNLKKFRFFVKSACSE